MAEEQGAPPPLGPCLEARVRALQVIEAADPWRPHVSQMLATAYRASDALGHIKRPRVRPHPPTPPHPRTHSLALQLLQTRRFYQKQNALLEFMEKEVLLSSSSPPLPRQLAQEERRRRRRRRTRWA